MAWRLTGQPAVIGACGSACDSSAVEQRPTPEAGSGSCPELRELEESKYEVVAGARRLRAAKLAELEKLPVRVVKLTDAEAIEAQCVELSVVGKIFSC